MGRLVGLSAVLFFLTINDVWAQSFQGSLLSVTQKRGLSNNSVTGIVKDRYGFLWIATRDGLNKFDGHEVLTFFTEDRNLGTVTDNYFNNIHYFGGDSIILASGNSIYAFNITNNKFSRLPVRTGNEHREGEITTFFQNEPNILWIGKFDGGLLKYNLTTNTGFDVTADSCWKHIRKPVDISYQLKSADGTFWISTFNGDLINYEPNKKKIKSFSISSSLDKNTVRNAIRTLAWKNDSTIYVGTWGSGLWTFNLNSEKFSLVWFDPTATERYPYNDIRSLFADENSVWFGTNGNGLFHLNPDGKILTQYSVRGGRHSYIGDNDIYSIFKEQDGIFWIGTDGAGLQQINSLKEQFDEISVNNPASVKLNNNDIQSIFIDSKQKIWVATNGGGVNIISPETKSVKYLTIDKANNNALLDNTIYTMTEDRFGRIWIGSNSGGIQVYHPNNGRMVNLKKMYNGPYNFIYHLFYDSQNNIWVSTYTDNFILRNISESLNLFTVDSVSLRKMNGTNIQSITEDRSGLVWLGTNSKGVFFYNHKTKSLTSLSELVQNQTGPKPRNITSIYEDRWSNIWISTSGTGLFCWIRSNNRLLQFTEKDGLMSNNLIALVADRQGNLWVSSPLGLGLVQIVNFTSDFGYELKYFQFNQNDGITNEVFNRGSGVSDNYGNVYFGGTSGITVFNPKNFNLDSPFKPIVPTKLLVNNEDVSTFSQSEWKNVNAAKKLTFDHNHYIISIEVAALEFTNPDKINYAYQLQGLDNRWVNTQTRRFFSFTSLPPGNYTLKIKSTNTLGNWNDETRDIEIIVLPPMWATWWAYLLYSLLGIFGMLGFIQWRSRKLEADKKILEDLVLTRTSELHATADELKVSNNLLAVQTEKLQRLDKKKTELFTNISHEFRTPLTLILNPLESLVKSDPSHTVYAMMFRNATRLNRLINQLLEIAKADSGQLSFHPKTYDFREYIKSLVTDFASLAKLKNRVVTESYPDHPVRLSFDPDLMEKIVTNLLSNSFKFTSPGDEIHITIIDEPNKTGHPDVVILEVEDSGIGIAKDQLPFLFDRFFQVESGISRTYEGSGIGLSLVKELILMHHGTIEAFSEPGAGTRMRISLPRLKETAVKPEKEIAKAKLITSITNEIPDLIDAKISEKHNNEPNKAKEPLKILLVEDNPDLLTYVKSLLPSYEVITALDGEEGLKLASSEIPDLIISDVMMPKKDGYTLTRELKNNSFTWHIPVILLTAKSSLENKITGLGEGADAYLSKPFQTAELLAVLDNLLKSREKIRAIYREQFDRKTQPNKPQSKDDLFLKMVVETIESQIGNTSFGVEQLASSVFMSRSQLNRKLSAIIDESPVSLIRSIRLNRAKILLENKSGTVSEIAYQVGFDNLAYFSKCFREKFGTSPSEMG